MRIYNDGHPEPMAFQAAGESAWYSRWLKIYSDSNDIFVFTSDKCNVSTLCGKLSGDRPMLKLQFDRNGWVRSYFRVFDPDTGVCIGNARCLKETAIKITTILMQQDHWE